MRAYVNLNIFYKLSHRTCLNVGADWTINPKIVSTTRYGYFFDNYDSLLADYNPRSRLG
jgi:hypothetical protein